MFNLIVKLRRRIHMALRTAFTGIGSRVRTIDLLGCSYEGFKAHIEQQFQPGMTWEQCFSGAIHLDHIRPLASFNLADEAERRAAFHYSNMQPLWAHDNHTKSKKWNPDTGR